MWKARISGNERFILFYFLSSTVLFMSQNGHIWADVSSPAWWRARWSHPSVRRAENSVSKSRFWSWFPWSSYSGNSLRYLRVPCRITEGQQELSDKYWIVWNMILINAWMNNNIILKEIYWCENDSIYRVRISRVFLGFCEWQGFNIITSDSTNNSAET